MKESRSLFRDKRNRDLFLRWVIIGVFLRIILMPFTLHYDFFEIEHMLLLLSRIGTVAFDPEIKQYYFPPMVYLIKAPFFFAARFLSPEITEWLGSVQGFLYQSRPYESWFSVLLDSDGTRLFRNILLLKTSLLAFDLAIAYLIARVMVRHDGLRVALPFWALNPVVLHSVFGHGGVDIIPAMFIAAALAAAVTGWKRTSLAFLILGAFAKVTPLILVPPLILVLDQTFRGRLGLALFSAVLTAALVLLFFGALGVDFHAVAAGPGEMMVDVRTTMINLARKTGLIVFYSAYLLYLFLRKKKPGSLEDYIGVFLVPYLILFTFNPVGFRYWVWIVAPVIVWLARHREARGLVALNLLALLTLQVLPQSSLQLGLFAPLCPEYFMTLPSFTRVVSGIVPQFWLLRGANIVFCLSAFALALYIWNPLNLLTQGIRKAVRSAGWMTFGISALGLSMLLVAGLMSGSWKSGGARDKLFLGGWNAPPDSFADLSVEMIKQPLAWNNYSFDAFELWLEPDSGMQSISVAVEKGGEAAKAAVTESRRIDKQKVVLFGTGSKFRGNPTILIGLKDDGTTGPRVGVVELEKHRGHSADGHRNYPLRGDVITGKPAAPGNSPYDISLAAEGLPAGTQLAYRLYRQVPTGYAETGKAILSNLLSDRAFILTWMVLLGTLLIALVILIASGKTDNAPD